VIGVDELTTSEHLDHHSFRSLRKAHLMNIIGRIAQTVAAVWILNVWFNRFNRDTGYRGGGATNMREEFEEYGLSEQQMYAVGATKVGLAVLMLIGLFVPKLVRPASIGLASFMLGAIGMHIKVGDPIKRSMPAISVLTLSTVSAITADQRS
jgi:uncharacterized membrane protein YphA (DoxX/SURF4 family)